MKRLNCKEEWQEVTTEELVIGIIQDSTCTGVSLTKLSELLSDILEALPPETSSVILKGNSSEILK